MKYFIAPVMVFIIGMIGCYFGMTGFALTLLALAVMALIWVIAGKLQQIRTNLNERSQVWKAWLLAHQRQVYAFLSIVSTIVIAGYFIYTCLLPKIHFDGTLGSPCCRTTTEAPKASPVVPAVTNTGAVTAAFEPFIDTLNLKAGERRFVDITARMKHQAGRFAIEQFTNDSMFVETSRGSAEVVTAAGECTSYGVTTSATIRLKQDGVVLVKYYPMSHEFASKCG